MSELQAFICIALCIAIIGFMAGVDDEMDNQATQQDRARIMAQINNINNGE